MGYTAEDVARWMDQRMAERRARLERIEAEAARLERAVADLSAELTRLLTPEPEHVEV